MIVKELRAEFTEYFQSPDAEIIVWLDPPAQWKGVVEHLKEDFKLVEYQGSQLEVKAEVELTWSKGDKPDFVVYLPGLRSEDLTVLKEYEFSGKVFEESILQSLARWGIEFEREHEGELEKILPILVARFAPKSRSFWRKKLTPDSARGMLFDYETVRKILANPETTKKGLKNSDNYEIFCDFLEDKLGGPKLRNTDAKDWTKRFTAYLIMTEVRAATGHPSSFPEFDIKPADDRHESECLAFVRDWLRNATYKEDFKRLSMEVEKSHDFSLWASRLTNYPSCESSLSVERAMEKGVLARVSNVRSLDELRDLLSAEFETVRQMADHFWSREMQIVVWNALVLADRIIVGIADCLNQLGNVDSVALLAQKYSEQWWRIDKEYRDYRAKYDGENRLGVLSRQLASVYREFLGGTNDRLLSIVQERGGLATEEIESQGSFWSRSVSPSRKKRAVFLVDALRFELARDLQERLQKRLTEAKLKCIPLLAAIPTLTPIGMAAVVAGDDIAIDLSSDGDWGVRSTAGKGTDALSSKEGRRKFLQKRHPKALFCDLADVLKPTELDITERNPIVVFTRDMDGRGHDSGVLNLSLDLLGQYLDGLMRAIRKLGSMGIEEIHLVSDHGFVILDELTDADKVTVSRNIGAAYRGHRCLVGTDLPSELGLVLDLPRSQGLQCCVPKGAGVFRARGGNSFFHGGLSPQELIVPHLSIVFAKPQPKYGGKLRVAEAIRNLIFDIEVLRSIPADGVLFGAPRFVEIVGILVQNNKEILRRAGPDLVINQDSETLRVRLRIPPGKPFSYGDSLLLELKDADTRELLDKTSTRIEVESDE